MEGVIFELATVPKLLNVNCMFMAKSGPIVIVEDDEDDRELFEEVLSEMKLENKVVYFSKAHEAMHYLRTTTESPLIVISDVNLPAMSGVELKKQIDQDEYLKKKSIPFVFLSTSSTESSVRKAYEEMIIQGYFEKPLLMQEMQKMFQLIIEYWKMSCHPY